MPAPPLGARVVNRGIFSVLAQPSSPFGGRVNSFFDKEAKGSAMGINQWDDLSKQPLTLCAEGR